MVSLLRVIVLWQLANTKDVSYIFGSVAIVTSIEFAVAIITANMSGMYAFWRAKILKTAQSSTGDYNLGSGVAAVKERSMGLASNATRGSKLGGHTHDDGYVRTDSHEELYPMSNLNGKVNEHDICVDTMLRSSRGH
jgi:hypothetical protein